jgi:hypothetical protein
VVGGGGGDNSWCSADQRIRGGRSHGRAEAKQTTAHGSNEGPRKNLSAGPEFVLRAFVLVCLGPLPLRAHINSIGMGSIPYSLIAGYRISPVRLGDALLGLHWTKIILLTGFEQAIACRVRLRYAVTTKRSSFCCMR